MQIDFTDKRVLVTGGTRGIVAAFLGADAPAFIVAEFVGAVAATLLFRWLLTDRQPGNGGPNH